MDRRIVVTVAVAAGLIALLALVGGVWAARRPISWTLFETQMVGAVGVDRTAGLEDGLHVYLCGTGGPMPDPLRGGSCLGVVAGERAIVFDAGSGGARNLALMGFPMDQVEAIYLTHLHSDHIDGLGELLLQVWLNGSRTEPIPVIGPAGTVQVIEGFRAAYTLDAGFRTAHHGSDVAPPSGFGGTPTEIPTDAAPVILDDDGLQVRFTVVTHDPAKPAFGYRVDYGDRSVAISGDTTYDPRFVEVARGVDLMVHEALDPEMTRALGTALTDAGSPRIGKVMFDILDYHATPEQAAQAAVEADADQLVLTHVIPPVRSVLFEPAFLGDAPSIRPDVVLARDGLRFDLPRGSDSVRQVDLF